MASFRPDPDERVFTDTKRYTLQGKKVKFPVRSRIVVTDRRFGFHDLGKMAPFQMQMGILIQLMVKGKPVSLPLNGLKVSRGKYARNTKLLMLSTDDGQEVLLDRFDKSLEWLRDVLAQGGAGLSQTAEEEWRISI